MMAEYHANTLPALLQVQSNMLPALLQALLWHDASTATGIVCHNASAGIVCHDASAVIKMEER